MCSYDQDPVGSDRYYYLNDYAIEPGGTPAGVHDQLAAA